MNERIKELVKEYISREAFVHILFIGKLHYNGWIISANDTHIEFKDKKDNAVLVLKIEDITLMEENEW